MARAASPGRLAALVLLLGWTLGIRPAMAEAVGIKAAPHEGHGRIVFNWKDPVTFTATIAEGRLVVRFGRPIEASLGVVVNALPSYVRDAKTGPDGRSASFGLTGKFGLRSFDLGSAVVVDILDRADVAKQPDGAALKAAQAARVPIRSGEHPGYSRIVFDWPGKVGYRVSQQSGKAVVVFDRPALVDLGALKGGQLDRLKNIAASAGDENLRITLTIPANTLIKDFTSGNSVVIDIAEASPAEVASAIKARPAEAPEPIAKTPTPAKPPPAPAKPSPPATAAPRPLVPGATAPAPAAQPVPVVTAEQAAPFQGLPGVSIQAPPAPAAGKPLANAVGSIRLDWTEPVAAAVFRRAGNLWMVFDKPAQLDLAKLRTTAGAAISQVESVPTPRGIALRLTTPAGINPRLRRDGFAWIFDFAVQEFAPQTAIEVKAQPQSPTGARMFLPVAEPGEAIVLTDPAVGDNLVVVPVIPIGHSIAQTFEYPQLAILPSAQGIAIQLRADDIRVRPLRQGVELTSTGTFYLSPVSAEAQAGAKIEGASRPLARILNLERWQHFSLDDFNKEKQSLQRAIITAKGPKRERARIDLSGFYLAHGFGAESLGVLHSIELDRPQANDEPELRLHRGAASFLMARLRDASDDLFHASLDGNDEGAFWRAAVMAGEGDLTAAHGQFKRANAILRPYPKALKIPLGLLVTEAAIEVGDVKLASNQIEILSLAEPSEKERAQIDYVEGRLRELAGDFDGAVSKWEGVQTGPHRPSAARASVARAELLLKMKSITRLEVIEELEKLRFAWRGDEFEFALLRRLGELYIEEGIYRDGLRTLRQAATYFRTHEKAPEVTQMMTDTFSRLYLESAADSLPPVTAIALYEEFKELTPAGERGDEMIRKLADRLVNVDLLAPAEALLESQVQFRLKDLERARVGTRLAVVYMLDRDPEKALETLKTSEIPNLPEALAQQRLHLKVRAFADLNRFDEALELIKEDKSLDADRLRAEIYWENKDWANASQALRRIVKDTGAKPNAPLDDSQARKVLDLAVALTLGNNERAVARLKADFGPAMDAGPFKDAFRLIANPQVKEDFDISRIPGKVAEAENFRTFMAEYRQRLKSQGLSAIN